jgi:hypothetical protein
VGFEFEVVKGDDESSSNLTSRKKLANCLHLIGRSGIDRSWNHVMSEKHIRRDDSFNRGLLANMQMFRFKQYRQCEQCSNFAFVCGHNWNTGNQMSAFILGILRELGRRERELYT